MAAGISVLYLGSGRVKSVQRYEFPEKLFFPISFYEEIEDESVFPYKKKLEATKTGTH